MALITDPDLLNQGTEVVINTGAKTIALAETGNLSSDGVTLKALYSFLKEEWKDDATLIKYDFPMTPITDEQMQIGVSSRNNGWNFANSTTRELIRTGGWQEVNASGTVTAEYAGIVTLGSLEPGTQVYYQQQAGGSTTNFVLPNAVNQAVKVFENGSFDYRSYMTLRARRQGNKYATSTLTDIGVTTMTYQVYRFPLATSSDIKILGVDTTIDANADNVADIAPYDGMSITFHNTAQSRTIGGVSRNFGIIIDGNNGTLEQIYTYVQWALRRTVDIDDDASSLIGLIAPELLEFVGDTLNTKFANANPEAGGNGVFIDNIQTTDVNRIVFRDNTNTARTYPYTANLTINFSSTLQSDADAIYRVFFTNDDAGANAGNDFGTSGAIIPRSSTKFTTTNRLRNSNIATITTSAAHGLEIGDVVEVVGVGGSGYNGTVVVATVPSGTQFTYANSGSNEGSTADTGGTVFVCMGGKVGGQASKSFGYEYDTNIQRGSGSDAEDAPLTAVAIGLNSAQYVLATATLQRSTSNSITLTAPTERNYSNA